MDTVDWRKWRLAGQNRALVRFSLARALTAFLAPLMLFSLICDLQAASPDVQSVLIPRATLTGVVPVDYEIQRLPPLEFEPAVESPKEELPEQGADNNPDKENNQPAEEVAKPEADESAGDAGKAAVGEEVIVKPPPKIWDISFELGFDGSTGNTDTRDIHIGLDTERHGRGVEFTFDADYRHASQDQVDTANRMFVEARNEWLFEESPWTAYIHGTVEFDEFRAYNVRLTNDGGVGYQFFKNDIGSLTGRSGVGGSREIGGPDNHYVPEGVAGFKLERKLTKRQTFKASVEYFFDWKDFGDYRFNTKAGWEVILDEAAHLSLKLGVFDRYDSTPNGVKANDLDYSAVLLWKF